MLYYGQSSRSHSTFPLFGETPIPLRPLFSTTGTTASVRSLARRSNDRVRSIVLVPCGALRFLSVVSTRFTSLLIHKARDWLEMTWVYATAFSAAVVEL
jgi:hypothetical protein